MEAYGTSAATGQPTATLVIYEPKGGVVAQYFGQGSNPAYPTNRYSSYTYLPDGALSVTSFVDADGSSAGRGFAVT